MDFILLGVIVVGLFTVASMIRSNYANLKRELKELRGVIQDDLEVIRYEAFVHPKARAATMLELLGREFPECAAEFTLEYATVVCREIIAMRRMDGSRVRKEIDSLFERNEKVDKRKIDASFAIVETGGGFHDIFMREADRRASELIKTGPPRLSEHLEQNKVRMFLLLACSRIPSFYGTATSVWIALDRCMISAKRCMRGRSLTSGMLGMRS